MRTVGHRDGLRSAELAEGVASAQGAPLGSGRPGGPARARQRGVPDTRVVLDSLHLLGLAIGLGGLWSRARSLHDSLKGAGDTRALRRAYAGAAWWRAHGATWVVRG